MWVFFPGHDFTNTLTNHGGPLLILLSLVVIILPDTLTNHGGPLLILLGLVVN